MAARGLSEGQLVGFEPVPMELRPVAPAQLTRNEEADTTGDLPHAQMMGELSERLERDMAAGIVDQAKLEQARHETEQGAPWTHSL